MASGLFVCVIVTIFAPIPQACTHANEDSYEPTRPRFVGLKRLKRLGGHIDYLIINWSLTIYWPTVHYSTLIEILNHGRAHPTPYRHNHQKPMLGKLS